MKKIVKTACILLSFPIVFGCASTKVETQSNQQSNHQPNQQNEESKKMEYLEKYQIRNEIAFDCPKEVTKRCETWQS